MSLTYNGSFEGLGRGGVAREVVGEVAHEIEAGLLVERKELGEEQMNATAEHRVLRLGQAFEQIFKVTN